VSTGPHSPHNPADSAANSDNARQDTGTAPDIDEAVDVALRYLDDPAGLPADLSPTARLLLESITAARGDTPGFASTTRPPARDIEPPPLAQDSLAVALGLVPEAQASMSGERLRLARQRAGLKPSQLAAGLAAGGHDIRSGEILRWESAGTIPVTPTLIEAIATLLRVPASALGHSTTPTVPASLAASGQFRGLVRRWAAHTSQTLAAAQSALLQVAVAPARRGTGSDDETVIAALRAYVDAHTGGDRR
jgi:hypothetical protein